MNTMRSEMLSLSHSLMTSRATVVSSTEEAISSKCFDLEKERVALKLSLSIFECQLASAKREVNVSSMKGHRPDEETRKLKVEHAEMRGKKEEELMSQMKVQLVKGHAEMKKSAQ